MSIEDINITGTAYWYKQTDDKKNNGLYKCLFFSEQGNKTEKY